MPRCPYCDSGPVRTHNFEHRCWTEACSVKPDPRLSGYDCLRVGHTAPQWLYRRVYCIAKALSMETGYGLCWTRDRGPGSVADPANGDHRHALLFVTPDGVAAGAAGFSYEQRYLTWPLRWHMNFIWFAPAWRHQGQLTRRWPELRARYGEFGLEGPQSPVMYGFARKMGLPETELQIARPR